MNNINHWYERYRTSEGAEREAAFGQLYKHVFDQALGAIYTVLHRERPDLATNAASDTLLKLTQFRGDSEFATWAYRIARNVALMEARRMNSRREVQFHVDADEVEDSGAGDHAGYLVAGDGVIFSGHHEKYRALRCGCSCGGVLGGDGTGAGVNG